jgi:hypothetical protein
LVSKLARLVQSTKPLMPLLYRNGADHVAICFVFTPIFLSGENLLHDCARHAIMATMTRPGAIDEKN